MKNEISRDKNNPKLIVIELNEINFDLVKQYSEQFNLPSFKTILKEFNMVETYAENEYKELEPWIQWVSSHTGKTFNEHKVFRLGDGAALETPLIFEKLEDKGYKVGAISPMNARNNLKNPSYFIPDPWTKTHTDGSGFSLRLAKMLRQTVNDNSQGSITFSSAITLIESIIKSFSPIGTWKLSNLLFNAKNKKWNKALFLDQLLHLIHLKLLKQKSPDISFIFLNAGAHIQHHYYFNSKYVNKLNPGWYVREEHDPILDMLKTYDNILEDYINISKQGGTKLILATGLSQVPYNKAKYYYRLKDHTNFLNKIGITADQVHPRMTRDFEVLFRDKESAKKAIKILSSIKIEGSNENLFNEIEDRDNSLFVTLTYPNEITSNDKIILSNGKATSIAEDVIFVAIKNGMHSGKGFLFTSSNSIKTPQYPIHISEVFSLTQQIALET